MGKAGIVIIPWRSTAGCSLSRGCYAVISVDVVLKSTRHKKPPRKHALSATGWRKEGENLLSDSDVDDIEFFNDQLRERFLIRGSPMFSEMFFSILQVHMSGSFEDMIELEGAPLHSNTVSGKVATAGLFSTQHGCFGRELKTFIPWRSVMGMSYTFSRFGWSRVRIQNISHIPLVLKGISYEAYETMVNAFSAATSNSIPY